MSELLEHVELIADNFVDEYFGCHHQEEYRQYLLEIINICMYAAIEKCLENKKDSGITHNMSTYDEDIQAIESLKEESND